MDKKKIAKELVKMAREVVSVDDKEKKTFKLLLDNMNSLQSDLDTFVDKFPVYKETDMKLQKLRKEAEKNLKDAKARLTTALSKMIDAKHYFK